MRFTKVVAHRFGPLADETLELEPGMNVICGPNEAGKSTWHAAIYAALCGMRRARGRPAREDQNFAERHRPWNGEDWRVGGEIVLADGRTIELHHDLDGKVDSRATDAVLGVDVSHEIIQDGAPDGSVWLGLDRRAFLATACVRQAEVAQVVQEPASLQEHLQRAAANAGADETAARALQLLKDYQSEHVGLDRLHSTKPLRAAKDAVQTSRLEVEEARREQRRFEELVSAAEARSARAREARSRLRQARAAAAQEEAEAAARKVTRGRELAAVFPDGRAPRRDDDQAIARRARAALHAWDARPEPQALAGESAEELEAQLRTLPGAPEGDLAPDADLEDEYRRWITARSHLEAERRSELEAVSAPSTTLAESELRDLAHELEREPPTADEAVQRELQRVQIEAARIRPALAYGVAATGARVAALAVAGLRYGLVAMASSAAAAALGAAAFVAGAWVALRRRARRKALGVRLEELRRRRADYAREVREFEDRRAQAVTRLLGEGIEATPAAVRAVADELAGAEARRRVRDRSRTHLEGARQAYEEVTARLSAALSSRGVPVSGDIERAWSAYRAACEERARQAMRAARRTDLQERLEARRQLEVRHARDVEVVERVRQELRAAAAACGLEAGEDPTSLHSVILLWLDARDEDLKRHEERVGLWQELQSLLAGRTPEELEADASAVRKRARELGAELERDGLDPAAGDVHALEVEHDRASHEASLAEGAMRQAAERRSDLGDAEARLAEAERELERVTRLGETLQRTREFLERAQDRVQRDIAPRLSKEIERHLSTLTAGRYTEVRVNPEDLQVRVRDDAQEWRPAEQLSHGTQEQIYLLLRAAMARILPKNGEVCPLILDDVTVHSDERRTEAVLGMLHELSAEQQVIVFSQEQEVLAWAEERLGERDRLVRLEGP